MLRTRKLTLQGKIVLLEVSIIFLVSLVLGLAFARIVSHTTAELIGENALDVARTVALIPTIRDAFPTKDPANVIWPLAEKIRKATGAEFVVVGNREGIRYSHPLPDRIGKFMVGGDNAPALEGKEYVSEAVGSLGPSLRGKAPVYGPDGEIIGLVSVGFMLRDIREIIWEYDQWVIGFVLIGLALGAIGAVLLARSIKKEIFGLEPIEIATVFQERMAVLQSIREGIIAINDRQEITVLNTEARRLLNLPEDAVGRRVTDIIPNSRMPRVLETGQAQYDQEMILGDTVVVANRVPITINGRVAGVVATFRDRTEMRRLGEELSEVKRYAEALRSQTHEFTNKMHTVSGLVQLGRYDQAVDYICDATSGHQNLIELLMRRVPDPTVAAIILGKYNRAGELRVRLEVDENSSLRYSPGELDGDTLVTVLGNLLDNAVEAVKDLEPARRVVRLGLSDEAPEFTITVDDTGPGIPPENLDRIFDEGFSTKDSAKRGIGLALVKRAVENAGGQVTVESSSDKETRFVVRIPKATSVTA